MKLHNNYYYAGLGAVGVLLVRIAVGIAFMAHGWSKIQNPFGWMGEKATVPGFLQALAALSEFGGGLALILGLLTPMACFGIMCTMFVAILSHKGAPFVSTDMKVKTYEDAGVYFAIAFMFFFLGPGRLSLDALLFKKQRPMVGEKTLIEPV